MKSLRGRYAFTLVELLVVIAIIAILMGLLLPVTTVVTNNARKVQALHIAHDVVVAINTYQAEYAQYPAPVNRLDDGNDFFAADNGGYIGNTAIKQSDLMDILRVPSTTNPSLNVTTYNSRLVQYLDVPPVKDNRNPVSGIDQDGFLRDPWGGYYRVRMDTNYNHQLPNPYTADTGAGPDPLTAGVIVWSIGKDGMGGLDKSGNGPKNTGASQDDIVSWQ
ncbi:MAG: type II secretion system protein [Chthoniobacteraceae bacterium]